jgi:hypothetical protein
VTGIALSTLDLRWPIGALCACVVASLLLRAYLSWATRADRARAEAVLRRLEGPGEPRRADAPGTEHDG